MRLLNCTEYVCKYKYAKKIYKCRLYDIEYLPLNLEFCEIKVLEISGLNRCYAQLNIDFISFKLCTMSKAIKDKYKYKYQYYDEDYKISDNKLYINMMECYVELGLLNNVCPRCISLELQHALHFNQIPKSKLSGARYVNLPHYMQNITLPYCRPYIKLRNELRVLECDSNHYTINYVSAIVYTTSMSLTQLNYIKCKVLISFDQTDYLSMHTTTQFINVTVDDEFTEYSMCTDNVAYQLRNYYVVLYGFNLRRACSNAMDYYFNCNNDSDYDNDNDNDYDYDSDEEHRISKKRERDYIYTKFPNKVNMAVSCQSDILDERQINGYINNCGAAAEY